MRLVAAIAIAKERTLRKTFNMLQRGTADRKLEVPRVNGNTYDFYVDSDHAGDRKFGDTWKTGIKFICNGMQWHWRSTKQTSTAQSSTEAELVALSECMKDANLRMWIAEEIGHKIQWPIKIQVKVWR